jgi:hypothetical protein
VTPDPLRDGRTERRSARIALKIPVRVEYFADNPGRLTSFSVTTTVNAHGALLRLPWGVPAGRELLLENLASLETQMVRVVFVEYAGDDYFDVGVEFTEPRPKFWGASFPPEDWFLSHPDAKQDVG